MKIIKQENEKHLFLDSKEIDFSKKGNLSSKSVAILKFLSKEPMYPKQLAKRMKLNEQIVYYYIKKLKKMGLIELDQTKKINGIIAKIYKLSSESFFFKFGNFKEGLRIKEKKNELIGDFIEKGDLDALIIVGSPEPHGEKMARSRDGYLGIDLALFLGSYIEKVVNDKVRMDLGVREKELKENNLIVVGGPIVNKVASLISGKIPIYIDIEKKKIISKISNKHYSGDNIGIVCFCKSPFNKDKKIIFVAGISYNGTKASIVAITRNLREIEKGNKNNRKVFAKVVEGIDRSFNGVIDDVNFLE